MAFLCSTVPLSSFYQHHRCYRYIHVLEEKDILCFLYICVPSGMVCLGIDPTAMRAAKLCKNPLLDTVLSYSYSYYCHWQCQVCSYIRLRPLPFDLKTLWNGYFLTPEQTPKICKKLIAVVWLRLISKLSVIFFVPFIKVLNRMWCQRPQFVQSNPNWNCSCCDHLEIGGW